MNAKQSLQLEINSSRSNQSANYQFKKVDILFYDSVSQTKRNNMISAFYQFVLALIFIVFLPIDRIKLGSPVNARILDAIIIALIAALLQSIGYFLFRCVGLGDNQMLLTICDKMGHSTDQILRQTSSLDQCVSKTVYNKPNQTLVDSEGLTPDIKKKYTAIMAAQILQIIKQQNPCLSRLQQIFDWFGFFSIIYAIVALAIGQKNTPEMVLLIVYIVLQSITKITYFVIFLVIALIPVLCIAFCFCRCFCDNKNGQESSLLPQAQPATQANIHQSGGTCSICFQNFVLGSSIIKLKCSQKHVFHPICISGWAKVRSTCPICRQPF